MVGNDLRKLILDILGLDGVSTKSGEHTSSKTKARKVSNDHNIKKERILTSSAKTYSSFPFLTKKRGLSGRQKRPTARMMAHSSWMAIGIR